MANKAAKKAVAKVRTDAYKDFYDFLTGDEGQKKVLRLAKQRKREQQDVYQSKLLKDGNGIVVSEKGRVLE